MLYILTDNEKDLERFLKELNGFKHNMKFLLKKWKVTPSSLNAVA